MQILLRVVSSFANYRVWWLYKTNISFKKTLHELLFCVNPLFSFYQSNLRILRLKLTHMAVTKQISNMKNRKV